jgi:hypothetical protein
MTLMFLVIYKTNVCASVLYPNWPRHHLHQMFPYLVLIYGPVIGLLLYVIISDLVLLVSFMWYIAYLLLFIDHSTKIIQICACSFTGTIVVHLLVQF